MMDRFGWGYGMMDGNGWVVWALLTIGGAVLIVALVLFALWALSRSSGRGGVGQGPFIWRDRSGMDEAAAIARRRLANGEITTEQYDEIMRMLARH